MQEQLSFPVRLGVFYESLCPDSKNFIIHQLQTAYSKLSNITFLELIPYGNAKVCLCKVAFALLSLIVQYFCILYLLF